MFLWLCQLDVNFVLKMSLNYSQNPSKSGGIVCSSISLRYLIRLFVACMGFTMNSTNRFTVNPFDYFQISHLIRFCCQPTEFVAVLCAADFLSQQPSYQDDF